MDESVRERVYFNVTFSTTEREGHWVAKTLETTIFGYGETQEEAEASAADANALIVRELKMQGMAALRAFMEKYGIEYSVGAKMKPTAACGRQLMRAA